MQSSNWFEPLDFAQFITYQFNDVCFLFSAAKHSYSGSKSFLAFAKIAEFSEENKIKKHLDKHPNDYLFGYIGYEKTAKIADDNFVNFPGLKFVKYKYNLVFDHEQQTVSHNCPEFVEKYADWQIDITNALPKFRENRLNSNMSDENYLAKVSLIREKIANGDFCQANLTRKFWGEYEANKIDHFLIFKNLYQINPAPYSSFIKENKQAIISSSPERFLSIDRSGLINSRPIKGTIKKGKNAKKTLALSEKDQAENLMIVDLMRHDIGRYANPKSVEVDKLFAIDEYATLTHMSSSISAKKIAELSNFDIIYNCLPPGSMTGAPKIKVIDTLKNLEQSSRNIYSGSIGYFKGEIECDFSVVIRTILMSENKFQYQVGGGIIYDSTPEKELEETKIKDSALKQALNICK